MPFASLATHERRMQEGKKERIANLITSRRLHPANVCSLHSPLASTPAFNILRPLVSAGVRREPGILARVARRRESEHRVKEDEARVTGETVDHNLICRLTRSL